MLYLLTLLAFALRLYQLDGQSYWIDEAWTLRFAHMPWAELWRWLSTEELHPPLYFPLLHLWVSLAGETEFATRFISAGFSLLAVPLTYRLGAALGDRRIGLLAAALLAVAPFQVWHAQDARNYSMLTAASALSMWAFVSLWQGKTTRRWWLLYIFGTAWTVLSHYHGLVIIGVQGLWLLLTLPRRGIRPVLRWGGALALALLPLAAWLGVGPRLLQSAHWLTDVPLAESFRRSAVAFSVGKLVPSPQALTLTLPFLLFYALGLLYAARRPRWGRWRGSDTLLFLLCFTLAPNVAAWLFGLLRTPVFLERYLIPVQIGFLLTAAAGIVAAAEWLSRLTRRGQPAARAAVSLLSLLALLGIGGWVLRNHFTNPAYAKPDWRGVVRTIEQFSQPGDAILLTGDGGEMLLDYYYHGSLPVYFDFNTPVPPPARAVERLSQITAGARRLWFTPYGAPIDSTLEGWLAQNKFPAWQAWIGRKRLALVQTQAEMGHRVPVNHTFGNESHPGPRLTQVELTTAPVAAGDLLATQLTWQTDAPLPADLQLSLRLVNPAGDIFAQSDWPPLAAAAPTSHWTPGQPVTDRRSLWIPADVPPGDYLLQLVVYNPADGAPLGQPALIPDIRVAPAQISPPPEALAVPNFTPRQTASAVRLIGHAAPDSIQPGEDMWLWLVWQAASPPAPDAEVTVTLRSGSDSVNRSVPLAQISGPPDGWQAGQVRRSVLHLPTSPRLSGDAAQVSVQLSGWPAEVPLAEIALRQRQRTFAAPQPVQSAAVDFGSPPVLTLLGFDPPPENLTLYWQAQAELPQDYIVFVQWLNPAGQVVAQRDSPPQNGAAPTRTWLPGEVLADPQPLPLPANLPPGQYRLIAGLYNPVTGARLPAATGSDFVELTAVTVE